MPNRAITKIKNAIIALAYKINFVWRLLATGFAFAAFGIGAVILSITVFPVLCYAPKSAHWKKQSIRIAISRTMLFYLTMLRALGLMTYEVNGRENLASKGQLIVCNHPSLLDVVFIISLVKRTSCAVKSALWENPFTRGVVSAAEYIPNTDSQFVEKGVAALNRGESLIIFPQGTRSPIPERVNFKRGAANTALFAEKDLTPICISCLPETLAKGDPWYKVPARRPHFTIDIGQPFAISPFLINEDANSKRARQLNEALESYFNQCQQQLCADTI